MDGFFAQEHKIQQLDFHLIISPCWIFLVKKYNKIIFSRNLAKADKTLVDLLHNRHLTYNNKKFIKSNQIVDTVFHRRNFINSWLLLRDIRSSWSAIFSFNVHSFQGLETIRIVDVCIFVLIPLVGGGTIYSNAFFCCSDNSGRSIYIHRTEMWVVSLKSWSSVEFGFKKISLIFLYFEELSMYKFLSENVILAWFCSLFCSN